MTGEHIGLKELERLTGIPAPAPAELPPDLRAAEEHLRHCQECAELARAFHRLRAVPP